MISRRPRLTMLLSLPFIAPSIALNAACQFAHEHEPLTLWGSVALSTGAVFMAAYLPLAIMRAPGWTSKAMLGAGLVFLLSFNLASGIGAVSVARSDLTGSRRADNNRLTLLQAQLAQDEASRKSLAEAAGNQTPALAEAALATLRQDARWSRSKECKEATRDDSRAFCAEYAQKKAVSDAVTKIAELDIKISTLRTQVANAQTATAGESEDPQADAVATTMALIGTRPELHAVGVGTSVQKAAAAEVLPALATTAITILFSTGEAPGRPASPAPQRLRPPRWRRRRSGQRQRTNANATGQKADKQRPDGEDAAKIVSTRKDKKKNPDLAGFCPPKLPRAERDRRIVQLQASGQSQADIAAKLGVSVRTVRRVMGELQPARSAQKVVPIKRADQAE